MAGTTEFLSLKVKESEQDTKVWIVRNGQIVEVTESKSQEVKGVSEIEHR